MRRVEGGKEQEKANSLCEINDLPLHDPKKKAEEKEMQFKKVCQWVCTQGVCLEL